MAQRYAQNAVQRQLRGGRYRLIARGGRSFHRPREEVNATMLNGWNDQSAIEVIVPLFARGLGDQHTAVTCGSVEKPMFVLTLWIVLGADGIVGAQFTHFQRAADVLMTSPSDFDQTSQSSFRVGRS